MHTIYPLLIIAYIIFGVYCAWIARANFDSDTVSKMNRVGKLIYRHGYAFMVALIIIGMLSIIRLGLWLIYSIAKDANLGGY